MKRIFSILLSTLIGISYANAQCSNVVNNFEIRMVQTNEHNLNIQMRYHDGANAGAKSVLPTQQFLLDGLVFAISWPTTSSDIKIINCQSTNSTFEIMLDKTSGNGVQNKVASDNVQTLLHNNIDNVMQKAFEANWTNDEWIDLANVSFSGKLNQGDYFSLLNCDYGMAHPNAYYGNSTTDPWFALLDNNGEYQQYSPKMITEVPNILSSSIKIYPIPTTGDLTIEVDCAITTNAVVKVVDMNGRLVKTILFDLEKGNNKNQINIGELPAGEYMIQLTDGKAINFSKQVSKL